MDLVEQGAGQAVEIEKIPAIPGLCDSFQGDKGKIDIGDCSLYIESEPGTGKDPLVLLHGGPGGTHHDFHPLFSRATSSFQSVNYYDQRGCGQSDYKPGKGYSIEQAVEDLERLRRDKGFDKIVVLGHSYGGILAQAYALKHPESLAGLVLVASGLGFPADLYSRYWKNFSPSEISQVQAIDKLFRSGKIDEPTYIYNKRKVGEWKSYTTKEPTPEQMAYAASYEWNHDPEFREAVVQQMHTCIPQGSFDNFHVPTLIVEGDDPTWDERKPQVLKQNHPNAKMVDIPGTAHMPFIEKPNEFFQHLGDFVKTLS